MNRNQLSPTMPACDIGNLSLVKRIYRAQRCQGSEVDRQGRTALHHAILNTKWSVDDCAKTVQLLLEVLR